MTGPVRVFLLDDHEVVRRGVRDLLEADGTITVCGEAASAGEALVRIPAARPDVALLDVRLPDGDGIEVCRELRSSHPELACLMLTSFADEDALFSSIMAGAAGYVLKQIRGGDLLDAVRTVAAGESMLDQRVTGQLLERIRERAAVEDPLAVLTPQERRILHLIGEGQTNREIAQEMHLSEKTVKNYVTSLLSKLGMSRRTQAAVFVTRLPMAGGR